MRELFGRGALVVIEGGDHLTTLAHPESSPAVLESARSAGVKARAGG